MNAGILHSYIHTCMQTYTYTNICIPRTGNECNHQNAIHAASEKISRVATLRTRVDSISYAKKVHINRNSRIITDIQADRKR